LSIGWNGEFNSGYHLPGELTLITVAVPAGTKIPEDGSVKIIYRSTYNYAIIYLEVLTQMQSNQILKPGMKDEKMSTLEKISFFQNNRSEVPNQELARELVKEKDTAGIKEIAENLANPNPNVSSDCLKVLYEIGYIEPILVAPYVREFLTLIKSKNNRMVWGSMIALATIARLRPEEIMAEIETLRKIFEKGTVITVLWSIRLFASLAAARPDFSKVLFPVMLQTLETCIPRDVPTHVESMLPAINSDNRQLVLDILLARQAEFTSSHLARCKRVIKKIQAI